MLDQVLTFAANLINSYTGIDISNYKEFLVVPSVASLFAFYFLYKGLMFVIKIIFYILISCLFLLVAAKYFGLI